MLKINLLRGYIYGCIVTVLFSYGCREIIKEAPPLKHNIIVLLDLSDRIVKTDNQVERDENLINSIYQAFVQKVRTDFASTGGMDGVKGNQFRLAIASQDDVIRYDDLLEKLYINTAFMDKQSLSQRLFRQKSQEEFSNSLHELYERAKFSDDPTDYKGADIWKYFEEDLSENVVRDTGISNQLFLLTDGIMYVKGTSGELSPISHQFPELNVFLLEATPGNERGAWGQMQSKWANWFEKMGVNHYELERQNGNMTATREKIFQFLSADNLPAYPITKPPQSQTSPPPDEEGTENTLLPTTAPGLGEGEALSETTDTDTDTDVLDQAPIIINRNNSPHREINPCKEGKGDLLPGVSCAQYEAKVLGKVDQLETYLKRIVDKKERNKEKSIDLACQLFVNEQSKVYVSSLNNPTRARPIRKYLNGLMNLSYDEVIVDWTNIQYVSELRKGPDGKYYGYVHIEQRFEGYMDGLLVYGDITEKKIEIILKTYEIIDTQGRSNTRWDVFLSDIGVEQTMSLG